MRTLQKVTASSLDCRTLGLVNPVKDQGQCGSCWAFAGVGGCESAHLKAGTGFKPDGAFGFSEQSILDCVPSGGCDGDWPETVLEAAKGKGLPLFKNFGNTIGYPIAYKASPGACKSSVPKDYFTIVDYGYVGQQSGVPTTQAIKDALSKFGPLVAAVAVDDAWAGYSGGVYKDSGYREINHAVKIVGWDDSKGSGCWIVQNQWSLDWGDQGYMYAEYGSNSIGYGALWVTAAHLPPPPPPPDGQRSVAAISFAGNVATITYDDGSTQIFGGDTPPAPTITPGTTLQEIIDMLGKKK